MRLSVSPAFTIWMFSWAGWPLFETVAHAGDSVVEATSRAGATEGGKLAAAADPGSLLAGLREFRLLASLLCIPVALLEVDPVKSRSKRKATWPPSTQ
jgi:hypothetical protein